MRPDTILKRAGLGLALLTSASALSIAGEPVHGVPATDTTQIRSAIGFCLAEISRKADGAPVVVEGPCADTRGAWSGAEFIGDRTALSFLVSDDSADAYGTQRSGDSLRLVTCEVGGAGKVVRFHQRLLGRADVFSYPSDLCSPPGTDRSTRRARYVRQDR